MSATTMEHAPPGSRAPGTRKHTPSRWWALAVIGLAQLMVVLDATIVNIALPSAQHDLGFTNDARTWIVTAYSLAFGSLLLLGGRLADLFGRRNTFIIGIIGFGVVSALGGAANGFTMLVIARALQGMFGALLAPSALSLLTTTFTDPKERGRAFGVFGAIAGSGGAIGLLLGGVLTEHLDWRWTMYVNCVIAVVAILGALVFIRRQTPVDRPKLDLLGTGLVAAGLFSLVFGFSNAETYDWSDPMCWAFLAGGAVLIALFAFWETRAAHPLLPLRILGDRNRAGSYLSVFISGAGMFGVFLFLTYYLQTTLHYTPIQTGLGFLPMVGMMMLVSQLSTNVLVPYVGPKATVPVGMALAAGALVLLTGLGPDSSYAAHVLPSLLMLGAGLALVMPVAMSLATLGVASHDQGVASAMVNTMQQVGGSIGTALFNTMAATAAVDYFAEHRTDPDVAVQAGLHSYAYAYWWAAGFFAAGLLIAVLIYRKGRPYGQRKKEQETTQEVPADVVEPKHALRAETNGSGVSVHGKVLRGRQEPAAGAVVTLIDQAGRQIDRITADQNGRYAVLAPTSGNYVLLGASQGHEPRVTPLTVGTTPHAFDILLSENTGELEGRVVDRSGPIAGALTVVTDEQGTVSGSALTATDGGYRHTELVPGIYTLTVTADGYQPTAGPVTVAAGEPTNRDVELRDATRLHGTVRDAGGAPLHDAHVALLDEAGSLVNRYRTGEDGGFAFADLPGGSYTIVASGYPPASNAVTLTGTGRDDVELTLSHAD
ncbi:MFS transporter [Sciscionella marina]|uniref:MFS transporter n=1 Tax=Sciscionella marina TaxID=508770 RepID=UPI0003A63FEC|nr:MFS transporter [Sciscionella marina]